MSWLALDWFTTLSRRRALCRAARPRGAPVWPWKEEGDLLQGPNGCRAPLARAYGLNATEMGSIPAAKGDPATGVRAPLAPTL
jgi:hypothetical protein